MREGNENVMNLFTADDRLAVIVTGNYHLLPVINRFGIRLGFGDSTIEEICVSHKINMARVTVLPTAFGKLVVLHALFFNRPGLASLNGLHGSIKMLCLMVAV